MPEESSSTDDEEDSDEEKGIGNGFMKIFNAGVDSKLEAKRRKREKREEKRMMAKLRQNKHWAKVSVQMKFKNIIRIIIKRTKKEPDYVINNF